MTAALRSTNRLIRSIGGWGSSFRGIVLAFVVVIVTGLVEGVVGGTVPYVPSFVGTLLANLALVQLNTAWVHIVLSPPSPLPFWHRLPPMGRTFRATGLAVLAAWVASMLQALLPALAVWALHMPLWDPREPSTMPYGVNDIWKGLLVLLLFLLVTVLLVVPAQIVLVRVQASLLPPDADTIIAFDRSFEGRVEPAVVGGRGYATMRDALATFSRASWVRLYKMYIKIIAIGLAFDVVMAAILIPEIMLMLKNSKPSSEL